MRATVAVLADCANITGDGKLNIMGIFDVLNAAQVPAVHPAMHLIVRLVADPSETGVPLPVEIQLIDADGNAVFEIKGQATLQAPPSGEQSTANYIVALNNTRFERFGDYEWKVLVGDEPIATIPLRVQEMKKQPPLAQ